MSQGSANSEQPSLNPTLQAVFSSLDLHLETELARFRQQSATDLEPQHTEEQEAYSTALVRSSKEKPAALTEGESSKLVSYAAQPDNPNAAQLPLNRYLESSEDLLRALAQKQLAPTKKSLLESLLTPLGISSLLLLLVTSALLGLALTAPEGFGYLISKGDERDTISAQESESESRLSVPPVEEDVSADAELSSSNPAQALPAGKPNPDATQLYSDLASALLSPSVRPHQHQSEADSRSPQKKSSETEFSNVPLAKTSASYHYVLIEDTSNSALKQVQNAVKDAYLVKFPEGVRIQAGAFTARQDAEKLVESLDKQGISALIYRADSQ